MKEGELLLRINPCALRDEFGTGHERALFYSILDNAPSSVWDMTNHNFAKYVTKQIGYPPDNRRLAIAAQKHKEKWLKVDTTKELMAVMAKRSTVSERYYLIRAQKKPQLSLKESLAKYKLTTIKHESSDEQEE